MTATHDERDTKDAVLRETALRDRHEALGARLIPFAGWLMPVQYSGVIDEHRTVRSAAGLFDLGHMGQVRITGADALPYLQLITTNDVSALEPGGAQYSLLPNEQGGVIDDIIVYRLPDEPGYLVVVNAANHAKDVAWMQTAAADPTAARGGRRRRVGIARHDRHPRPDGRRKSWPD